MAFSRYDPQMEGSTGPAADALFRQIRQSVEGGSYDPTRTQSIGQLADSFANILAGGTLYGLRTPQAAGYKGMLKSDFEKPGFADTIRYMLEQMNRNVSTTSAREGIHPGTTVRLEDPRQTLGILRTLSERVTETERQGYRTLMSQLGITPKEPIAARPPIEFDPNFKSTAITSPDFHDIQEFISTLQRLYHPTRNPRLKGGG